MSNRSTVPSIAARAFLLLTLALLTRLSLSAATTDITDTTTGTATPDGSVLPGEYVGSSLGVNAGFGDMIGQNSVLSIDSSITGLLNFGLVSGNGTGIPAPAGLDHNVGVIYLDSIAGGASSTLGINDTSDPGRAAISGNTSSASAELLFALGFGADFAITLDHDGSSNPFSGLYQINTDGSLTFLGSNTIAANGATWEIQLPLSSISVPQGGSFSYFATLINASNAFRSNEFIGIRDGEFSGDNIGANFAFLSEGDGNTFHTVAPEVQTVPDHGTTIGLMALAFLVLAGGRRLVHA